MIGEVAPPPPPPSDHLQSEGDDYFAMISGG
jgi:hypothetical protein